MARRVMFDLTTLFNWGGSPVGIIRVEISLARALTKSGSRPDVVLCRYEKDTEKFYEITSEELEAKIHSIEHPKSTEMVVTAYRASGSRELGLDGFDAYVSTGFDWADKDVVRHKQILGSRGIKIVRFIYDLIPFKTPQFLVPDYLKMKLAYFPTLIQSSDHLICISKSSQNDLHDYVKSLGVRGPVSHTIPLGTEIISAPGVRPPDLEGKNEPFFLFVGTYDARKNIDLLYLTWMRLYRRDPARCPRLVLIGKLGGYASDLIYRMKNHPGLSSKFTFLGATDEHLKWCYEHAHALLFPSFYEGWGLPITEALGLHCPVLAATNSSIMEAAQGGAIQLDELDPRAWEDEIVRFLDEDYRKAQVEKTHSFRLITWDQVSERFREILLSV